MMGQRSVISLPAGRQHASRKMPAGGMTAEDKRPPEPRQLSRCHSHLLDNVTAADIGTKIVAGNGNADAVRVKAGREMTEIRAVERLPITDMDKHDDRLVTIAGKKIDGVARPGPIADRARDMALAICFGIPATTGDDGGMFRNPRPVVV